MAAPAVKFDGPSEADKKAAAELKARVAKLRSLSRKSRAGWLHCDPQRPHMSYEYLAAGLLGYACVTCVLGAAVKAHGHEKAWMVGGGAVFALFASVFGLGAFRTLTGPPGKYAAAMSPPRRLLFRVLCCLLGWSCFYTTGLQVVFAIILFAVGMLPEDTTSPGWYLLFPMQYGIDPIQSQQDILAIGAQFLASYIPFYLLSIIIEAIIVCIVVPKEVRPRDTYSLGDSMSSLGMCILPIICGNIAITQWGAVIWARMPLLSDAFQDTSSPVTFFACLVATDYMYYLYHRTSHIMSWMWVAHYVHHSSEEYNLCLGPRESWTESLTPSLLIDSLPLALFFPIEVASATMQIKLTWQFWFHVVLPGEWPTLELLVNSPSLHRVHHAKNPERLGKNFGAIFSIWDRIHGTYEPEGDRSAIFYGTIPAANSWDPILVNLEPWFHMLGVQPKWDGWMAPLRHWVPPDGVCPKLGSKLNPKEKYSKLPATSLGLGLAIADTAAVFICAAVLAQGQVDIPQLDDVLGADVAANVVGVAVFLCILAWSSSAGRLAEGLLERREALSAAALVLACAALLAHQGFSYGLAALQGYAVLRAGALLALYGAARPRSGLGEALLPDGQAAS